MKLIKGLTKVPAPEPNAAVSALYPAFYRYICNRIPAVSFIEYLASLE